MTRTEVWVVRHGATEWSRAGKHTSTTDLPLLPDGVADARRVGERLAGTDFGLVLSSPRRRATQTARHAGFAHAEVEPDLVEWDYGPGEGLTSEEIRQRVPDWRVWTHGAPSLPEPGTAARGERIEQVSARLTRVVHRVRSSGLRRVLVFGHGHSLRALAMVWLGQPVPEARQFPLDTGAVSVLGYEKDNPAIVRWNSI